MDSEEETDFFGLSRFSGIQSKDIIPGKEYTFQNLFCTDSYFTGTGIVREIFESDIRGILIVFQQVRLVYLLDYNLPIDPQWELALPINEIQLEMTEKQQAMDCLENVRPQLPLEIIDAIFQMLEFHDLEKLKDRIDLWKIRHKHDRLS
jgi:hypothetical protein